MYLLVVTSTLSVWISSIVETDCSKLPGDWSTSKMCFEPSWTSGKSSLFWTLPCAVALELQVVRKVLHLHHLMSHDRCNLQVLLRRSWLQTTSSARFPIQDPPLLTIVPIILHFWVGFQDVTEEPFCGTVRSSWALSSSGSFPKGFVGIRKTAWRAVSFSFPAGIHPHSNTDWQSHERPLWHKYFFQCWENQKYPIKFGSTAIPPECPWIACKYHMTPSSSLQHSILFIVLPSRTCFDNSSSLKSRAPSCANFFLNTLFMIKVTTHWRILFRKHCRQVTLATTIRTTRDPLSHLQEWLTSYTRVPDCE